MPATGASKKESRFSKKDTCLSYLLAHGQFRGGARADLVNSFPVVRGVGDELGTIFAGYVKASNGRTSESSAII
jgi:hypothetical protein